MKRRLLLLGLVLASFSGNTLAQKQVYVGVTAGGNFSTVFFNHLAFPTNIRTGLQAGANIGFNFKHFAPVKKGFLNTGIQFSVNYVEKGWVQEFTAFDDIPNFSTKLRYLELPFSGIIYFGKKKTKIFVSPGIYGEFLIGSTSNNLPVDDDPERDFINVGVSDVFPFDADEDNTIGAGGKIEAGLLRDFGFGSIQLAAHFSVTITNILDFGTRSSGIPDTSNNLAFGASIGYFFKFGQAETE